MIKAEWGTKRQCPKCGTRFYDLQHDDPVTCIQCGHAWAPEPVLKSKQALSFESAKTAGESSTKESTTEADDDLDLADADSGEPSEDAHVDIGGDDDLSEVVVDKEAEDE